MAPTEQGSAVTTTVTEPAPMRNLAADGMPPPAPRPVVAAPAHESRKPWVTLEVVQGDLTQVVAPIAVVGRYEGLPARGPARAFDDLLDDWISRAIEYDMIGSDLGQLFYIPIPMKNDRRAVAAEGLLIAGLGEPGHFSRDGLRYLMTNVALAVKTLGHDEMSTPLLGFSRGELPLDGIVRGMLEGIADALERLGDKVPWPLHWKLVHLRSAIAQQIWETARTLLQDPAISDRLHLEVLPEKFQPVGNAGEAADVTPADLKPQERSTRITITSPTPAGSVLLLAQASARLAAGAPRRGRRTGKSATTDGQRLLQYSALAEAAVIPVRDQKVHSYFLNRLPQKLIAVPPEVNADGLRRYQENFGKLLTRYLIPDDFQRLIETGDPLTLVVDATTACYPWEMAGFKGHRDTCFFGTHLKLARQFRTDQAVVPGIAPPLNHSLKVLVIADPAPGGWQLPGARQEGQAVLDVLQRVKSAWGKRLELSVTARIGSYAERDQPELAKLLIDLRQAGPMIESAEPCDPLELLALLVNEAYDVVHYAGHGVFDPAAERMGWVFENECVLSAAEIFRVRQVPRLVFANACLSSVTADLDHQRHQQVGLAEAFFARGIENYIGAGWLVNDQLAKQFAVRFYSQVLGLRPSLLGDRVVDAAPPATLGEALAEARRAILHQDATWGAYQHYGQSNAKLVAFPNRDESVRAAEPDPALQRPTRATGS